MRKPNLYVGPKRIGLKPGEWESTKVTPHISCNIRKSIQSPLKICPGGPIFFQDLSCNAFLMHKNVGVTCSQILETLFLTFLLRPNVG